MNVKERVSYVKEQSKLANKAWELAQGDDIAITSRNRMYWNGQKDAHMLLCAEFASMTLAEFELWKDGYVYG